MSLELDAFREELTKLAISAGLAHSAMLGRVAQGARIAPGILQATERAALSGARATPAMGNIVRSAGQDVRAAGQATAASTMANPLRQRFQQADALGAKAFNTSRPLATHDAFNNTHAYSQQYKSIVAPSVQMADPKGLLTARPNPTATAPTVPAFRTEGTVKARPGPRNMSLTNPTAQTVLAPRAAV